MREIFTIKYKSWCYHISDLVISEGRKKGRTQMPTPIDMTTEITQNPPFYSLRCPFFHLESTKDLHTGKKCTVKC